MLDRIGLANYPYLYVWRCIAIGFCLSPRTEVATPALLLSLRRGRLRQPSPLRRVIHVVSPVAYQLDLPTSRTAWNVTGFDSKPFSPGGCGQHPLNTELVTALPIPRGFHQGGNPNASPRGGGWRGQQADSAVARSHPAWPLRYRPFFRNSRWTDTGCVPPLLVAEFERNVLYGCGPAQVGFDASMSL